MSGAGEKGGAANDLGLQPSVPDERVHFLAVTPRLAPDAAVQKSLGEWKAAPGTGADRKKIEQQLRQSLKEQFDARMSVHQKEIEQLEAKVKKLREQLELRRKKQDEIVDFRLQQLLREAQGLGWGTEPVTGDRSGAWGSRSSDGYYQPGASYIQPRAAYNQLPANVPDEVRALPQVRDTRTLGVPTPNRRALGEPVTQPKAKAAPSSGTSNSAY